MGDGRIEGAEESKLHIGTRYQYSSVPLVVNARLSLRPHKIILYEHSLLFGTWSCIQTH